MHMTYLHEFPNIIDRFIATRRGEILVAERTLRTLVQELEQQRIDDRELVIEFVGPPRQGRVF